MQVTDIDVLGFLKENITYNNFLIVIVNPRPSNGMIIDFILTNSSVCLIVSNGVGKFIVFSHSLDVEDFPFLGMCDSILQNKYMRP